MKKLINQIQTIDDKGNTYIIDEYQEYIPDVDLNNPKKLIPGLKSYRWRNSDVGFVSDKVFNIAAIDTKVKKIE
jgi:hypothetical protein